MPTTLADPRLAASFQNYAEYHHHLRIRDRQTRRLVPLRPNRFQRRLHNARVRADRERRPWRAIVLKSRQVGVSTYAQSAMATDAFTRVGVNGLTLAHEDEASTNLHSMLETMLDELPTKMRPKKVQREQGKRLVFEHGSRITVRTAGAREVGRSFAIDKFHASEAAFYPDAGTTMLAARQAMQPLPGTWEIVESTPNGIVDTGQWFYEEWQAAVAGESEYEPFFFPWFEDPHYVMPAPKGLEGGLDEEEKELRRRFSLSLEQLAWRRWTLVNRCGRSIDKLRQEYPSTADEAFLVSGRPFFDPRRVAAMPVTLPLREGRWVGAETRDPAKMVWRDDDRGNARIYRLPHADHRYVVAVDVAGQIESTEADAFSDKHDAEDYSVCTVIDRSTLEVVAQWRDRTDIGLVGYYAAKLGRIYGNAIIAVEQSGGYGLVVLDALKRLPYLGPQYHREVFDERTRKQTKKLGWDTTMITRPKILEGLNDLLREHPDALKSEWLQREMRTFIRGRRPEAAPGHHDDVVLSTAIGVEVAREYPHRIAA